MLLFDWISDLINGIGNAISSSLSGTWEAISGNIWNVYMNWIYTMVYNALADFFTLMTEIGANLFDLDWVKAALHFFNLFGWGLFLAGLVVAIFDTAIEYQTMGRLNIKKQVLPFLYGLLAVNLFTTVPVELFRFSVNLQNTFAKDLANEAIGMNLNIQHLALDVLAIYLCLDNDNAGQLGCERIAKAIHELGDYSVCRVPPQNKDWDEDLKALNGREAIPAEQISSLETPTNTELTM